MTAKTATKTLEAKKIIQEMRAKVKMMEERERKSYSQLSEVEKTKSLLEELKVPALEIIRDEYPELKKEKKRQMER